MHRAWNILKSLSHTNTPHLQSPVYSQSSPIFWLTQFSSNLALTRSWPELGHCHTHHIEWNQMCFLWKLDTLVSRVLPIWCNGRSDSNVHLVPCKGWQSLYLNIMGAEMTLGIPGTGSPRSLLVSGEVSIWNEDITIFLLGAHEANPLGIRVG